MLLSDQNYHNLERKPPKVSTWPAVSFPWGYPSGYPQAIRREGKDLLFRRKYEVSHMGQIVKVIAVPVSGRCRLP